MNTVTTERPPLTKIVGTVADITAAEARNKPGKIELEDGKILRAFADKLQMVQVGGTYDFGCERNEVGGVTYNNVKAIRASSAPQHQHPRAQAQHARQDVQRSEPPEPERQPQRQPNNGGNGNGGNYYRPTAPKDARRMFICSQMNALITSHQVQPNAQAIADAIAMLSEAYDATLGQEDAAG